MTLRVYNEDQSDFVEVPGFAFGDSSSWEHGQSLRKDVAGKFSVLDREYTNRVIAGLIPEMTQEQMFELKAFFKDTLNWTMNRFFLRVPLIRHQETWNPPRVPWLCGAYVTQPGIASTQVKCGHSIDGATIVCGQLIPADYEWIGPLRLRQANFKASATFQGIYEATITAELEGEG